MAVASILVGFASGLLAFALTLLAGYGLLPAIGAYIVGGIAGSSIVLIAAFLRLAISPRMCDDMPMGIARA